jgi:hypothetical protein
VEVIHLLKAAIILTILVGIVNAQGDWNVYCTTDSECCAVAEQPSGNYVVPMLLNPVDWSTAWAWMNANGYGSYGGCRPSAAEVAVWNVYCDTGYECCAVAEQPSYDYGVPVLKTKVDWDSAWAWMNANGYGNYGGCQASAANIAVWNVYCDGTGKDCVVARQPTSSHANPVLKNKVDWDTAWNEMERLASGPTEATRVAKVAVKAKENCVKAGGASGPTSVTDGTPLNTGIKLKKGQRFIITQIDPNAEWSAGPGDTRSGDADGLSDAIFGLYTLKGQSFPYGSLVGQIDDGDYFFSGTHYEHTAENYGILKLMFWDSNNWDNSGELEFAIDIIGPTNVPPEPPEDPGSEISDGSEV